VTILLDAGALIAIEGRDRDVMSVVRAAKARSEPIQTLGPIVAQVWRSPARQATLVTFLRSVNVLPFDDRLARRVGTLLADSSTKDVVDAGLVAIGRPGDRIVTSDPDDLRLLIEVSGQHLSIIRC